MSEPLSDVLASQLAPSTVSATSSPVYHEVFLFSDASATDFVHGPKDGAHNSTAGKKEQEDESMRDDSEVLVAGGTDVVGGQREEIDKEPHSLYSFPCIH